MSATMDKMILYIQDVIEDYKDQNVRYVDEVEFTPRSIRRSVTEAIIYLNSNFGKITEYSLDTLPMPFFIPFRYVILYFMFEGKAIMNFRNQAQIIDGGGGVVEFYDKGMIYSNIANDFLTKAKLEMNSAKSLMASSEMLHGNGVQSEYTILSALSYYSTMSTSGLNAAT
jgi:hypothetical protein